MSNGQSPESGVKPPVALIAGPTASGKTGLGVALAKHLQRQGLEAAVINADSAQVYRDLRILSARPSKAEMQGVPHLLFGQWDGAEPCSAADWAEAAKSEIATLHARDGVPILVGGTGLYMRTLLEGIAPIPAIDPGIRTAVRALDTAKARHALEQEDAGAAARLASGDTSRTIRALEVVRSTGKPLAYWQQHKAGGIGGAISLRPVLLLPEREWLYERCDRRFEQMLNEGATDEVAILIARRLDPALPVMRAIGVAEIAAMLKGELSSAEAIAAGQQATRRYAKRQYTWFRHQPPAEWPRLESYSELESSELARLFQF